MKKDLLMVDHTSKVAFMFPPASDEILCRYHLGVAYIQAYLAKYGIASEQVAPAAGSTLNDYVEQLISTNARIIGFTCYDYNYFLVRSISARIKRKKPKCIVIAGGPTATFSDDLILGNTPDIDLCVRFEGEETTLELVSRLSEGASLDGLEDIKGITIRQGDSIYRTPNRELAGSKNDTGYGLDVLPSPYLEGILRGTEGSGILTARGCTHHCTYCNFSAISKHTIRYHSIDRVIAELHCIQNKLEKSAPLTVFINDDDFTINSTRAKDICERIVDEGIKLRLSCLCRADNLDEETIELLGQAGVSKIIFGLESAVPRVLRNVKKVCSTKPKLEEDYAPEKRFLLKAKEAISLAKKYKMGTEVSVILGLPGETLDDGLKTVEFVRNLGVDSYSQNYLVPYRGTELFRTAKNYGLKIKQSCALLPYSMHYAYPVHKIPFWENSSLQLDLLNKARIVLRAFAGGPDTIEGSENGIVLALIESPEGNDLSNVFHWLSEYLAVRGAIIILGEENEKFGIHDLMLKASHRSGLPTHRYYYLKKVLSSGSEAIYKIINKPLNGRLLLWDPQFPVIRFSKRLEFAGENGTDQAQSWLIYSLKDKKDAYLLAGLAYQLAQQKGENSNKAGFWLDGVLQDGCMWTKGLCPALKLRRVIVNKNGEVLPCVKGQPLGTLVHSLQDLRNNAKEIYDKIRKERKCDDCPADFRCSKCLFPYPLDHHEYCELQIANLDLSGIIARSKMMNIFVKFSEEDL